MSGDIRSLFLWRGMGGFSNPIRGYTWNPVAECQFCGERLEKKSHEIREDKQLISPWIASAYGEDEEPDDDDYIHIAGSHTTTSQCPLCGWLHKYVYSYFSGQGGETESGSILREFDLDSPEVRPDELGTHLREEFEDVYEISPSRFERVVSDLLRAHGLQAVTTPPSKDGGADVVLYSKSGATIEGIVECKRFAAHRKVGVSLVRELLGAGVTWDVSELTLVTSSAFTSGAVELAESVGGYTISLVDARELLRMLQVYDSELPPIHKMDLATRNELVKRNREELRRERETPLSRPRPPK